VTADICERLRGEVAWEPEVGELMEEAAREIERLRLTDAEREAIDDALDANDSEASLFGCAVAARYASALRGLLERTR
jgi:hypothetical protein